MRDVLAHELGHIISGHVTYSTLANLLLLGGLGNLPFPVGLAIVPFELALLEWYRKAELSCDRAGLLGTQNLERSMMVYLKLAGGLPGDDTISLDEFLKQASEYETTGNLWDSVLKLFATVRVAELQRWVASGAYARIIAGDYPRRGNEDNPDLRQDYSKAADYYGDRARAAISEIEGVVDRARNAFSSAFRK
jgi:hypothetical protein